MKQTKEQKKVQTKIGNNLLVSAAAGAGKTFSLINRIMHRVMDPDHPVDLTEFVIVTFTKAAASEMKKKLEERLREEMRKDQSNARLREQWMSLPMVQISTIHSFCNVVIRNYFSEIGLDPEYRNATELELKVMREDALEEVLEKEYEKKEEDFVNLALYPGFVKNEQELGDMILALYDQAMNGPFPEDYYRDIMDMCQMTEAEEIRQLPGVEWYYKNQKEEIKNIRKTLEQLEGETAGKAAFVKADQVLKDQIQILHAMEETEHPWELWEIFHTSEFKKINRRTDFRTKEADFDPELKEWIAGIQEVCRDALKEYKEKGLPVTAEEFAKNHVKMCGGLAVLCRMAREFGQVFSRMKREANLVDFQDLEQYALQILVQRDEDQNILPTDAALKIREECKEIMIDEYQDSNLVQEYIMNAVSDGKNMFMVGDVKQSIYRFRNARPDLFLQKEKDFGNHEKSGEILYLSRNFRSRPSVLQGVNEVFEAIMHRDFGDIEYDENARMVSGVEDIPSYNGTETVDCYVYYKPEERMNKADAVQGENTLIEQIIRQYVGGNYLLRDPNNPRGKVPGYEDLVILARNNEECRSVYQHLKGQGIPVTMETRRGFYQTYEISLMVDFLKVLDNPLQDIPLAAVLVSEIGQLREEELAELQVLRNEQEVEFLWEALQVSDIPNVCKIREILQSLREQMDGMGMEELIRTLMDRTGIHLKLSAMEEGVQRKANLKKLISVAAEFDDSSYAGIHDFVRFLKEVKELDDQGEAGLEGNVSRAVQIMTIHKSKGLEFPICILTGMGNSRHHRSTSLLEMNTLYGPGMKILDGENARRENSVYREIIREKNEEEDWAEELRVLYVAMTRAVDKLILVGSLSKKGEWESVDGREDFQGFSRNEIKNAKHYYSLVLPVAKKNVSQTFRIFAYSQEEVEIAQGLQAEKESEIYEEIKRFDTHPCYHIELREAYEKACDQKEEIRIPVKRSVSELKRERDRDRLSGTEVEISLDDRDETKKETEKRIPNFATNAETSSRSGTDYGTRLHHIMSILDFTRISGWEDLDRELQRLQENGRLTEEEVRTAPRRKILHFLQSPLGRKMKKALEKKVLYREQAFVIGKEAHEIMDNTDSRQMVLIQGIMDGLFPDEEDPETMILMDYKTDRVKDGEELWERYKTQMDYYEEAIRKTWPVKQVKTMLYSFHLEEIVECEHGRMTNIP